MPTVAELKLEVDDATTLKLISQAFTEASGAKIQKIKNLFEKNSEFYEEMSHVYHLVRLSNPELVAKVAMKGKYVIPGKVSKTVSVAITSNQRFYGNLNVNIMRSFMDEIAKIQTDVIIVGSTGRDFLGSSGYAKKYELVSFPKDYPTIEETKAFLEKTKDYDTVLVYFPKFVTLLSQTVGVMDITQAANPKDKVSDEEVHILFEPAYSRILDFFTTQVRSLLFLRVMLEADLSRTAARLMTMSAADERSTELIKVKRSQLRKIQMSIANAKLLETFAGIGGWKK